MYFFHDHIGPCQESVFKGYHYTPSSFSMRVGFVRLGLIHPIPADC